MVTLEDGINQHGRVLLVDIIASLSLLAEFDECADDPKISNQIKNLRFHVGPVKLSQFLKDAENLHRDLVRKAGYYEFLEFTYSSTCKELEKWSSTPEFNELWVRNSLIPSREKDRITQKEVSLAKSNMQNMISLSHQLLTAIGNADLKLVLKKLGREEKYEKRLLKKILTMDMRMSELRILCLALDMDMKIKTSDG